MASSLVSSVKWGVVKVSQFTQSILPNVFNYKRMVLNTCCFGLLICSLPGAAIDSINWESRDACFINPMECARQLQQLLTVTPKHSHKWYGLKNTYLLALWEVGDDSRLKTELNSVDMAKAPPVFLTTVYTLKAKYAVFDQNLTQAKVFAERAVELTKAVNAVSDSMTRNAEVVVLYSSYLKDNKSAVEFVQWVEQGLAGQPNLVQMTAFNTAVGHLHFNMGNNSLARSYFLMALEGNLATNYKVRIAYSHHNIARTLQRDKNYKEAIEQYTWSLTHFQELGEEYVTTGDYTRLRFAETLLNSGRLPEAEFVFAQINPDSLSEYYVPIYDEVKLKLVSAEEKGD